MNVDTCLANFSKDPSQSFDTLKSHLLQAQSAAHEMRFGKRDTEELCREFLAERGDKLSHEELSEMCRIHAEVEATGEELRKASAEDFLQHIKAVRERETLKASDGVSALVLALVREGIRRTFDIEPYDTQMFALMGLLSKQQGKRGRLAQVKTGEGKSTIVAMLTAYLGLGGRTIDVISSSQSLAQRDYEKYKPYLNLYGLESSHVRYERARSADFAAQIVYGTNLDFEFSLLWDGLRVKYLRPNRPCDVAIVDEVDNMLLDEAMNSPIIVLPEDDPHKWVVPVMDKYLGTKWWPSTSAKEVRKVLVNDASAQSNLDAITDRDLERWITSWRQAQAFRENVQYVVKRPEIWDGMGEIGGRRVLPWDANTGLLRETCRWPERLHQFLELKHGLPLHNESVIASEMSHARFFRLFANIYGLTGTLGCDAERKELRSMFDVTTYDVPPHRKSVRNDAVTPQVVKDQSELRWIIADKIRAIASRRPVLILTPTIEESKDLFECLQGVAERCQVYNAVQSESEAYLLACAGRPGTVTAATNIAGRGADIVLTEASESAGGLHVIMTFWPNNDSTEGQGRGRAGRQGQKGTSEIIVTRADVPEKLALPLDAKVMVEYRETTASEEAARRLAHFECTEKYSTYLNEIYVALAGWDAAVDEAFLIRIQKTLCDWVEKSAHALSQPKSVFAAELRALAAVVLTYRTSSEPQTHFLPWLRERRASLISREIKSPWARCFKAMREAAVDMNAFADAGSRARHDAFAAEKMAAYRHDHEPWLKRPAETFQAHVEQACAQLLQFASGMTD